MKKWGLLAIILLVVLSVACNLTGFGDGGTPSTSMPSPTIDQSITPTQPTTPAVDHETPLPAVAGAANAGQDGNLDRYLAAMRPAFASDLQLTEPLSQYRISVTIDPVQNQLTGHQDVLYVNNDKVPQTDIFFRLYPNLPGYGGQMTVSNVRVAGEMVSVSSMVSETAVQVPLSTPLKPGMTTTIALDFEVTVPGDTGEGYGQFIHQDDVMALANFFPLIPAYDEENCNRFGNCQDGWNIERAVPYGDAVFSDSALFEVQVIAPAGWTVVASGSTIEKEALDKNTWSWRLVSGPMRDFNLVLSPVFKVLSRQVDDISVNSYFIPGDEEGGKRALDWSIDSLSFFNQRFGRYPFAEFDIVATPTAAGGIEYPGLIVMPIRNYGQTGGFFQWATIHEVAHQWWYSLVGNDQQDEPWLDEALTQYSTALCFEFVYGWDLAVEEVFEPNYGRVLGTEEDDSIDLPVAAYTPSNYGPLVYGKGPLFFHQLRKEIGDEALFEALQAYYDTFRYQTASGQDLLALIVQASDQDLTTLYQEWFGNPAP